MEGRDRTEKLQPQELTAQSGFVKWLDNFWYHYKWQTILVLFVLVLLAVSVTQCASEEPVDITVAYAGNYVFSDEEQKSLQKLLGEAAPRDFDENGNQSAALAQFSIYTEDQLTALFTYFDEETQSYKVDKNGLASARKYNIDRIQNLQTYVMTGDCAVWLVSPYVYQTMLEGKLNVVEVLSLKDTAFYGYYDAIHLLPEDTLLVLTQPVIGAYAKQENFACAAEYVQSIKAFAAP